jgi:hypothetical protein
MATITELQNNISGLSFRTTLNNNFANLNNDKAETATVMAVDNRLVSAEADIVSLDTRTTSTEGAVVNNTASINTLEEKESYNYTTLQNFTVPNSTYVDVINDTYPSLSAGNYLLTLSMMYTLNSNNTGVFFRFSTDGGTTWSPEIRHEPKDITDTNVVSYSKPLTLGDGDFNIVIQGKKQLAGDVANVLEMTVVLDRKA